MLCQFIRSIAISEENLEKWRKFHFHLTNRDKANLASLQASLQAGDPGAARNELHEFLQPLFYFRSTSSRWHDPLERFYALYALKGDGTFREPKDLTGLFAGMEYFDRCVVFVQGWRTSQREGMGLLEAVTIEVKKNMSNGVESPFNACFNYHALLKGLIARSTGPPVIRVDYDDQLITYKDVTFDVNALCQGLQDLQESTTKAIEEVLFEDDYGLTLTLPIKDDWANNDRGYTSFKQNKFLPGDYDYLDRVLHHLRPAVNHTDGSLHFESRSLSDWMSKSASITENMSLLVFFTAGQPARSTEFTDSKLENANRPRALLLDEAGQAWIVTRRAKWETIARREVFLLKKLSPCLSALVRKWVVLIRPVEMMLFRHMISADQVDDYMHLYRTSLWVQRGTKLESSEFNKFVQNFLSRCGCQGGSIASYRHVAVEMWRMYVPPAYSAILREDDSQIASEQRGHSLATCQHIYAREANHLPGMTSDVVRRFGKVSELWWRTMAVPGLEPLEPFETALEKEKAENVQMKKSLEAMKPMVEKVNETVDTLSRTVGTMYDKICGMEGQLAELKNRAKQASHDLINVRENQQNANHNLRSCSEGVNTLIDLFGKARIE